LREDAQKLKEENATLEGMVSLTMSSSWRSLGRLDLTAWEKMPRMKRKMRMPMTEKMPPHPPIPAPLAAAHEEMDKEGLEEMVLEQEALVAHEVILADDEPEMLQPRLYHTLMKDYEESPPRMMDDLDDLDDDPNEGRSDMDEWFPKDGSNDRD
jgi:hypothetical protein